MHSLEEAREFFEVLEREQKALSMKLEMVNDAVRLFDTLKKLDLLEELVGDGKDEWMQEGVWKERQRVLAEVLNYVEDDILLLDREIAAGNEIDLEPLAIRGLCRVFAVGRLFDIEDEEPYE